MSRLSAGSWLAILPAAGWSNHGEGRGAALERIERLVLIGFSGTGKSTVARLVGERLGWSVADTDQAVEASLALATPEIFARYGEAAFRAAERRELVAALAGDRVVVATGGGAVTAPDAWSDVLLRRAGTLVVALDARPETSLRRLAAQQAAEGGTVVRPMLAGPDPLGRIASLKAERQASYDAAAITIPVDRISAEVVAAEVAGLAEPTTSAAAPRLRLSAPSGSSAIYVGVGLLPELGRLTREQWPRARRAWLISDERVAALHGDEARRALAGAGFGVALRAVGVGEGSKSLPVAGALFDWLLGGGVERGDVVVALGGGVVGDLAGFVAATCLRGLGLVQVPTSLLAMVDSSVGGKTGINHAAGKNLIGAFYQPPLVVIDPATLTTLPPRELAGGWAEIVKHAVIAPSTPGGERGDLAAFLDRNAGRLLALAQPATTSLIGRNVDLKAAVVEADEREAGVRAFLNFGHTLGHAIEAAGYALLHGEAIALGMRAAARIGVAVGACGEEEASAIAHLLDRFGLPASAPLDSTRVLGLLGSDKKRAAGKLRWVLPVTGGGVALWEEVPMAAVAAALDEVSEARGVAARA